MGSETLSPVAFTLDALESHGALLDGAGEGALVLLPGAVARSLGVREELRVQERVEEGADPLATACGLGTPLLEHLMTAARQARPVAWAKVTADLAKLNHVRSLGERFVVRNGLTEVIDTTPGETLYLVGSVAWTAEADDRHEGVFSVCLAAADGATPDDVFQAQLDPLAGSSVLADGAPGDPDELAATEPWLAARAATGVAGAIETLQESVARRHARDHARIDEYFRSLAQEARAPRRRADAAAVAAKVAQLAAERDAKLAALGARFTLRVNWSLAALLCVRAPVGRVRIKLRRRKESRELVLRLPAGAHALDAPCCDGCLGPAPRPAVCDDRLHLLCEACAPSAQGRLRCRACETR